MMEAKKPSRESRGVALKPIVITEYGERLREYPSRIGDDHATDADVLNCCIGIHEVCSSWIDIRKVTAIHQALICRGCHLRVIIPAAVRTYGDLRKHFAKLQ